MGLIAGLLLVGSSESSCLMRLEGVGEVGSSSALRLFAPEDATLVKYRWLVAWMQRGEPPATNLRPTWSM